FRRQSKDKYDFLWEFFDASRGKSRSSKFSISGFLEFWSVDIFSVGKVRVSMSFSGNFLMVRGENPEIVNSLLKFF
ncbi:MAG: hypothetical protein WBA93_21980, partial [Microcoleaceae cyanobacterium]